jgi:phosphoheptose isomerase
MNYDMETLIKNRIKETIDNLNKLFLDGATIKLIFDVANLIVEAIKSGNKLMAISNDSPPSALCSQLITSAR